jgi:hypothetical protein
MLAHIPQQVLYKLLNKGIVVYHNIEKQVGLLRQYLVLIQELLILPLQHLSKYRIMDN